MQSSQGVTHNVRLMKFSVFIHSNNLPVQCTGGLTLNVSLMECFMFINANNLPVECRGVWLSRSVWWHVSCLFMPITYLYSAQESDSQRQFHGMFDVYSSQYLTCIMCWGSDSQHQSEGGELGEFGGLCRWRGSRGVSSLLETQNTHSLTLTFDSITLHMHVSLLLSFS